MVIRGTQKISILWIWLNKENLGKLLLTLKEFGFDSLNLTDDVLYDKSNIIQLGDEPYRIDLMMDVDGVDFDKCFAGRRVGELEGIHINFLSLDDLITAKRAMLAAGFGRCGAIGKDQIKEEINQSKTRRRAFVFCKKYPQLRFP